MSDENIWVKILIDAIKTGNKLSKLPLPPPGYPDCLNDSRGIIESSNTTNKNYRIKEVYPWELLAEFIVNKLSLNEPLPKNLNTYLKKTFKRIAKGERPDKVFGMLRQGRVRKNDENIKEATLALEVYELAKERRADNPERNKGPVAALEIISKKYNMEYERLKKIYYTFLPIVKD